MYVVDEWRNTNPKDTVNLIKWGDQMARELESVSRLADVQRLELEDVQGQLRWYAEGSEVNILRRKIARLEAQVAELQAAQVESD